MEKEKLYRPSSGSEGMAFTAHYCDNCIHEKWSHTQNDGDQKCGILTRTMCLDINDEDYPEEWQYNENDEPVCTAHQAWNWRDRYGNLVEPAEAPYVSQDPNQLELFNQ